MKGLEKFSFAHPVRDGFLLGLGFMLAAIVLEVFVLGVWYGLKEIGPVALVGAGLILFIVTCFVLAAGRSGDGEPRSEAPVEG